MEQVNENIHSINTLLKQDLNNLESTIKLLHCIKHVYSETRNPLINALKGECNSAEYEGINIGVLFQSKLDERILILIWILHSRIHLIQNMPGWIKSSVSKSVTQFKTIFSHLENTEEDEFLYMSLSQIYSNLLSLMKHSSSIDLNELKCCLPSYFNRVSLILNLSYDEDVFDQNMFRLVHNDLYTANSCFGKHMFHIFKYFHYGLQNVPSIRDIKFTGQQTAEILIRWLIDNMSQCETFDDISMYYSKFYISYHISDVDRVVYAVGKNDNYGVYCKKYNTVYEPTLDKHYVSNILKSGPENAEYNIACMFSFDHLFRQLVDNYNRTPIDRCLITDTFTFGKTVAYSSYVYCFTEWYINPNNGDCSNIKTFIKKYINIQ